MMPWRTPFFSALSSKSSNDKTHTYALTRHYTARGTWPSIWNHYAGFLPPAECRWDAGPTYYSPDVPVIHHCLHCPHLAMEEVWSMAPECVCVCVCLGACIVCTYICLFFFFPVLTIFVSHFHMYEHEHLCVCAASLLFCPSLFFSFLSLNLWFIK